MPQENILKFELPAHRARELLREIANDTARVVFTDHAKQRMKQRKINRMQILQCLRKGRFAEEPTRGVKGNWEMALETMAAGVPIKVATALDYNEEAGCYAIIITVISTG